MAKNVDDTLQNWVVFPFSDFYLTFYVDKLISFKIFHFCLHVYICENSLVFGYRPNFFK